MESLAAAQSNSPELNQSAEPVGEIRSRQAFGAGGPDLHTSLVATERLLGPLLAQVAAGFLQKSVADEGGRLPDVALRHTSGVGCPVAAPDQPRRMSTGPLLAGAVGALRPLRAAFFSRCGPSSELIVAGSAPP